MVTEKQLKQAIRSGSWKAIFPHLRRDGKITGRYSRYSPTHNLVTGAPHSHARENARRRKHDSLR